MNEQNKGMKTLAEFKDLVKKLVTANKRELEAMKAVKDAKYARNRAESELFQIIGEVDAENDKIFTEFFYDSCIIKIEEDWYDFPENDGWYKLEEREFPTILED